MGRPLQTKEKDMATIGTFTKQENGGYDGIIETLIFKTRVTLEMAEKHNDKSPDFRLVTSRSDLGAAWERTGKSGRYLSVTFDDPSFPAPVNCRLVKTGIADRYSLIWDRQKPAKAA